MGMLIRSLLWQRMAPKPPLSNGWKRTGEDLQRTNKEENLQTIRGDLQQAVDISRAIGVVAAVACVVAVVIVGIEAEAVVIAVEQGGILAGIGETLGRVAVTGGTVVRAAINGMAEKVAEKMVAEGMEASAVVRAIGARFHLRSSLRSKVVSVEPNGTRNKPLPCLQCLSCQGFR